MGRYYILIVDDEREVLDGVYQDLRSLSGLFDLELAESAVEAIELIDQAKEQGNTLALILCDHVMPGMQGVDLLISLQKDAKTQLAKKILITGQAGLEATIHAVNEAGLDYYVAKPWKANELLAAVIKQLTDFIIRNDENPLAYASVLDKVKIFEAIHEGSSAQ